MASLAAEQVARELECPVCYNQYKEPPSDLAPVMLAACGHTICRGDAATIISSKSALKCPSCSSITEAPHGAAGLPVNFTVVSLLGLVAGTAAAPAPPLTEESERRKQSDALIDRLAELQDSGLEESLEYVQLCAELKQLPRALGIGLRWRCDAGCCCAVSILAATRSALLFAAPCELRL